MGQLQPGPVTDTNKGLLLITPRALPALDPAFRPAVFASREFRRRAMATGRAVEVRLALEQPNGTVSWFKTPIFPDEHPEAPSNLIYLERILKFLLWSRG